MERPVGTGEMELEAWGMGSSLAGWEFGEKTEAGEEAQKAGRE